MARDLSRRLAGLQNRLVDDSLFLQAHETASPGVRAAIKTAIALHIFHFGRQNGQRRNFLRDEFAGFCSEVEENPLPCTLICLPSHYRYAASLCAAAMLPILAGVPSISCVLVGQSPEAKLLLTLELCGVEEVYCCGEKEVETLFRKTGKGEEKIFLLHDGSLAHLAELLAERKLNYIDEHETPHPEIEERSNHEALEFGFGSDIAGGSCVIGNSAPSSRLVLGAGCECFWLFDTLTPANFKAYRRKFSLLEK